MVNNLILPSTRFYKNYNTFNGIWNGTAILDDGTKVEVRDMYAFCEYCENKW